MIQIYRDTVRKKPFPKIDRVDIYIYRDTVPKRPFPKNDREERWIQGRLDEEWGWKGFLFLNQ